MSKNKTRARLLILSLFAIALVASMLILTSCGSPSKPAGDPSNTGAQQEQAKHIKSGMHKIGSDLPAGEYVIHGSGYLEVTKDSSGTFDSIITNDNYQNITYITVTEDQYLSFNSGKAWAVEDAPAFGLGDTAPSGKYKIGVDIAEGEYKVVSEGGLSYLEVSKDSTGSFNAILSNDNFEGERYITVKNGQYLKLTGCYLVLN